MEGTQWSVLIISIYFVLILTLLMTFFSASEMAFSITKPFTCGTKAEEGDKKFIRLLSRFLKIQITSYQCIQVGITFISLLQGASLSASLGAVIATWFWSLQPGLRQQVV